MIEDMEMIQAWRPIRRPRSDSAKMGNDLIQDEWWTGADGITRLIDSLTDDHRRYIARLLIDKAAYSHLNIRRRQIIASHWSFVAYAAEKDWGPADEDEPTPEQIRHQIRKEQERGEHLTFIRNSPLFKRMTRDLDWFHPGVV